MHFRLRELLKEFKKKGRDRPNHRLQVPAKPIHETLPFEVVSFIISLSLSLQKSSESRTAALLLYCQLDQAFRHITTSTPSFWTQIQVNSLHGSFDQAKLHLERSSDLPISLKIDGTYAEDAYFIDVLGQLLVPQASRIESLNIRIPSPTKLRVVRDIMKNLSMDLLGELRAEIGSKVAVWGELEGDFYLPHEAPRLRSLTVTDHPIIRNSGLFCQLTALKIIADHHFHPAPHTLRILSQTPNLITLTFIYTLLETAGLDGLSQWSQLAPFPRLESLSISTDDTKSIVHALSDINAPRLNTLYLSPSLPDGYHQKRTVYLDLNTVDWTNSTAQTSLWHRKFFGFLIHRFPDLRTLQLPTTSNAAFVYSFPKLATNIHPKNEVVEHVEKRKLLLMVQLVVG